LSNSWISKAISAEEKYENRSDWDVNNYYILDGGI